MAPGKKRKVARPASYPDLFSRAARKAGLNTLLSAAFTDETDPGLADLVDHLEWLQTGQPGKMFRSRPGDPFESRGDGSQRFTGQSIENRWLARSFT